MIIVGGLKQVVALFIFGDFVREDFTNAGSPPPFNRLN